MTGGGEHSVRGETTARGEGRRGVELRGKRVGRRRAGRRRTGRIAEESVISKLLKRHSKARGRTPTYSSLNQRGFQRIVHGMFRCGCPMHGLRRQSI